MATQRRFFALLCAIWILGSAPVQAATLHAFIVADTECNIRETIEVDVQNVLEEFQRMASYAGLELSLHLFTGQDYRPDDVLDAVDALQTKEEDVVIYYHSSHGFRTAWMTEPWPALDFGNLRALKLSEIILTLQHKPQHFTLILADCCNNMIPPWAAPEFYHLGQDLVWQGNDKQVRKGYRALLLDQKGTIVAAGSEPGKPSLCNTSMGGHFTHSLLKSLHEVVKSSECNWTTALRHTHSNLQGYGYNQHCIYDFLSKRSSRDKLEGDMASAFLDFAPLGSD